MSTSVTIDTDHHTATSPGPCSCCRHGVCPTTCGGCPEVITVTLAGLSHLGLDYYNGTYNLERYECKWYYEFEDFGFIEIGCTDGVWWFSFQPGTFMGGGYDAGG